MELNRIVFPAPQCSYSSDTYFKDIVYIPKPSKKKQPKKTITKSQSFQTPSTANLTSQSLSKLQSQMTNDSEEVIPCMYLPYPKATKLILFFHGNAEDIGIAFDLLNEVRNTLRVSILAVEYPGYGLYNAQPGSERVLEDATTVFDFLTGPMGMDSKDIILFGRSIGSGPSTHLAASKDPCGLILMSAYTSIRAVAKSLVGSLLSFCIADRFNNVENMKRVKCPTFIIHGQKDKLIPFQ